jgi:hypothetical protein
VRFLLSTPAGDEPLDVEPGRVFLAGYTGRDRAATEAHIAELAGHGIAPPAHVPSVFPLVRSRLTTGTRIEVYGEHTAGEGEFVLILRGDQILVGTGSDHTDRDLEQHSIVKSKQCCDKPVSPRLWRLDDVAGHWDELVLRSFAGDGGELAPYQEAPLASMMTPGAILDELAGRAGRKDGDVVWSGTPPILGGQFRYGTRFRAELADPVLGRTLACDYQIDVLPALDE